MLMELAVFAQLARACAPHVAVETLAAVARLESGFDDTAIHDNTTRRSFWPASRGEAASLAERLIAQSHSIDLGLMQVNSGNLAGLGLAVADAFDPCRSLAAAERVLVGAYSSSASATGSDEQAALRHALSRYNTGDAVRGIANGYVQRVQASAEVIVPAIRLRADRPGETPPVAAHAPPLLSRIAAPAVPPTPAASWDVYGQARAAKEQITNIPAEVASPGSADAGPARLLARPAPRVSGNQ